MNAMHQQDLATACQGISHACFIHSDGEANKTGLNHVAMHVAFKHNPDHAANAKMHSGAQTVSYSGGQAKINIAPT